MDNLAKRKEASVGFFREFLETLLREEGLFVQVIDNPNYLWQKEAEKNLKAFSKAFAWEVGEIEAVVESFIKEPELNRKGLLGELFLRGLIVFPGGESFAEGLALNQTKIERVLLDSVLHAQSHPHSSTLTRQELRQLDFFVFLSELFCSEVIVAARPKG